MTLEQVHEVLRFPASAAEVLTWRGHLSDKTNKFGAELPISSPRARGPVQGVFGSMHLTSEDTGP